MIALIPARGGSKGLPRKNILDFGGKPLIAHTIEAARNARGISEIIVSTDDSEIADVAIRHGANVPFLRPADLATDSSRAIDVYNYTLNRVEKEREITIPTLVVLLPTCPLRTAKDIENALELFKTKGADSVVSYVEEHHPVWWHKGITDDLQFFDLFPDIELKNRQEFQKSYYPNGAIYIFKTELLKQGVYYTPNSYAYIMPRERSVDIDTMEDFELAEYYLKRYAR